MKTYWCAVSEYGRRGKARVWCFCQDCEEMPPGATRKIRRATVYEDWFNTFDEAWSHMMRARFGK